MTIDWDAVLVLVDQRQPLLLELIEIFHTEHANLIPKIASAIEQQDAPELRLYAHRLKGSLRYFGKTDAVEVAEQLEAVGRSGKLDEAAGLFAKLQTKIAEVAREAQAYQQQHQSPP